MPSQYIYDMSDTWNSGVTTYTAIKMNVTDSASASDSLLVDLQIGSSSKFKVDKAGNATLVNSDAGASAGPILTFWRNSASPAASDILGKILFQGEDDGGAAEDYAEIYGQITDPTSGSEDATLYLRIKIAGTMTTVMTISASGVSMPNNDLDLGGNDLLNAGNLVGQICWFAMNTPPTGFLKANGAAVSRTTYARLFAAIGTTYGVGDGSTTFNLPDLRGEFIRGWDDGRGVDSGRSFGSAQTDAFQGHHHQLQHETTGNINNDGTTFGYEGLGGGSMHNSIRAGNPFSDGSNGTPRTASETRPRNIALLACIRY